MSQPKLKAEKPKILNLNAPTVRNQRTLIWLQHQTPTVSWSKWDGIVSSVSDYEYWSKRNTKIVGLVVCYIPLEEEKRDIDEFMESYFESLFTISKKVQMILISQDILSLKSQEYWSDNFDNLILLDSVLTQYPFLETAWSKNTNETVADAVAIFAHICRYNRLIDCPVTEERQQALTPMIKVHHDIIPEEIWAVSQYFKHKDKQRSQEIKQCLAINCSNPHIDRIVLLTEQDYSREWTGIPGATKIQQVIIRKRLTYANFLQYVHDVIPYRVYVILCNSDIYFADSLTNLWKINLTGRMLALLRWDDTTTLNSKLSYSDSVQLQLESRRKATLFGPRADSQDTWIFLSDSIKDTVWNYAVFDFELGHPGCDNAFAGHILQHRFFISNPALTFKTYHLHNSAIRTYSKTDIIKSSLYVNIAPSYIIDTQQKHIPDTPYQCICNELVEFEVQSSSISNVITYCTMLEKQGRFAWEPSIENHYFEPAIPIYHWKRACVTPNGLVYDPYTIYTGKYADTYPYWKDTIVSILTPMQRRSRMLAIPSTTDSMNIHFSHPDVYILHYMSRCLRLLSEYCGQTLKYVTDSASMVDAASVVDAASANTSVDVIESKVFAPVSWWIPQQFEQYITQFKLPTNVELVHHDESSACWADDVIGFVPGPIEFGREEMSALRQLLPTWVSTPSRRACVVVLDDVITQEFVDRVIIPFFYNNDPFWSVRCVRKDDYTNYTQMCGASMCVFVGGPNRHSHWAKLWALPKYCCVVEFQQELRIDGEFQHMAHVCDFKSWVLLLSKGVISDVQEQIMIQLKKWFVKNDDSLVS